MVNQSHDIGNVSQKRLIHLDLNTINDSKNFQFQGRYSSY